MIKQQISERRNKWQKNKNMATLQNMHEKKSKIMCNRIKIINILGNFCLLFYFFNILEIFTKNLYHFFKFAKNLNIRITKHVRII